MSWNSTNLWSQSLFIKQRLI